MAIVLGCDRPNTDGFLSKNDVLAQVNGASITWGMLSARLDFEMTFKRKWDPQQVQREGEATIRRKAVPGLLGDMMNAVLLREEASRNGVTVTESELKTLRAKVAKQFKVGDYADIAKSLGLDQKILDYQLETEVLHDALLKKLYPDLNGFSDEQVAEVRQRHLDYNRRVDATNVCIFALASNVVKRIEGGYDFKEAGKRYSELLPEYVDQWGWFDSVQLYDPAVCHWAFGAKVGDVGGPFMMEDGIAIVRVLDRRDGVLTPTPMAKDVARVKLARITFPRFEYVAIPTADRLREQMWDERSHESEIEMFTRLRREAKITYPCGTNFLERCKFQ